MPARLEIRSIQSSTPSPGPCGLGPWYRWQKSTFTVAQNDSAAAFFSNTRIRLCPRANRAGCELVY
jgi:hypothetical protein